MSSVGTVYHRVAKRWMASITYYGKFHYLGLYDTKEEAHKAWKKMRKKYPDRRFAKNKNGDLRNFGE